MSEAVSLSIVSIEKSIYLTTFYNSNMNRHIILLVSALMTFVLFIDNAKGQTNLYSETFTATNGTTVGIGNPARWTRNLNGFNPTTFSVQSNVFNVTNSGGEVIWNSHAMYIQGWMNVNVSLDLLSTSNMEADDYLRVYYKINGGAETQFSTNGNLSGNYSAMVASQSGLSGNTLEIVVRIKNNASNEIHSFDNVTVTGNNWIWNEDFNSYANGTTTSSKWSITGSGTVWSVQNQEMKAANVSIGPEFVWTSAVIDISAYSSVNLSALLKDDSDDKKEATDYIRVSYKLNGGVETPFTTNGILFDDFPSPYYLTASQNNLSGNTVQIIIRILCNANDEEYYFDDVTVSANNTPPSISLSTSPIHPSGCTTGATNGGVTLTVSNGRAPFSYLWSNGATTRNISGVGNGTYTVTVTGNTGTTATASQTITQPPLLSVSSSKISPTNNNNKDGSINLTVTGGTTPYTFAWNTGQTIEDLDSIYSGAYTWLVTDAAGCTKTGMEYVTYNDTIPVGSFIINMGVSPQTIANGLKPYGLIYQLIRNYKVPVTWSINPTKAKDAKDFTYKGVDYKGGTFIIYEGFITNAVKNLITAWQAKGVVGVYTSTPVVAPIYQRVTGFANVVVDQQNEGLVIPYFQNAEIPDSIYTVGLPSNLGACHDFFIMPHADPDWANHGNLYTFNRTRKGHIWTGCHATSMLEGVYNPSIPSQQMNFLTKTGLQCYSGGRCGNVTETHNGSPTSPFSYDASYDAHPIMQFMGDMTPSQDNGSEKWYIPVSTGGWNDNVARAIKTSDGSAGKEGIKLAFGYAYNNPLNGIVMYEGGHTAHGKGTEASQVAAERAFFNFILHASIEKFLSSKGQVPSTFINMVGQTVSITATGGTPPYTYLWSSTAPGTFSNPTSPTTTFTPTGGQADRSYYLTCKVIDACNRVNYISAPIEFLSINGTTTNVTCNGGSNGAINITVTGGTLPLTYTWSNGATTEDLSGITAGDYEVTVVDANGYEQNQIFSITQPSAVSDSAVITPATYVCSSDGAINLTPYGGTPSYTFAWSAGGTTEDKSGLPKGNYTVTITDSYGCQKTSTYTVIGPANLSVSFSPQNVTTYNASTGSINTTVSGGTPPYLYNWCSADTIQNITSKKAGPYSLTVTDVGGCTVSGNSTIGVNNAYTFKGIKVNEITELSWNSSSNWDSGVIPTSSTNVVIPAGCATTVTIPVNVNARDLYIDSGATLVVLNGKDININADFIVNGNFSAGTGKVLFTGTIEQNIITEKILSFYNLTMNNTSSTGLILDTNIIVSNQLNLIDGNIYTNDDTVKVTNTSTTGIGTHSSASYIVGYLQRNISNSGTVTYDYPLGYGAANQYFKASLIAKALKTTSKITGSVIPMERSVLHFDPEETLAVSDEAISYVYVQPEAMWTLEPDVQPTGGTYDIRLYTANFPNIVDNYFGIIKRISRGVDSNWVANFGSINSYNGEGRIKSHGYALKKSANSFSEFGIGHGRSNPLPIQLVTFDARVKEDGKTYLEWYTATEINNDFFTIEKMNDAGNSPVEVLKVKGAGNSSELKHYTAIDETPFDGVSYYRLKQTDFDGKYTYSGWVPVQNKSKINFSFSVYPNPAENYADLDFKNVSGELNVIIFDAMNHVVYSKSFSESNKPEKHRIIFSDILSKGAYFIQVLNNKEVHLQRLIVQ
jgi:hypothetical protein